MLASDKVSLTDVARAAGVSTATVSRVLNGSGLVSEATVQRVLKAAKDLDYVPDPRFRLMGKVRTGKSKGTGNIGILLKNRTEAEFVANPYYARLFWSIEREARTLDQHLVLSTLSGTGDEFLPSFINDFKVDGVLVADTVTPDFVHRVESLVPVVMVNSAIPGASVCAVMPDEDSSIRKALGHLRELGHQRIYYFGIADQMPPSLHHAARAAAFDRYIKEWNLPEARPVVLTGRTKSLEETAKDQLIAWRDAGAMPTALVCGADVYALAFIEAARTIGMTLPEQLSVIGIDDTILCDYSRPKLTSIRQPFEAMGAAAVQMLWQRIRGTKTPRHVQTFDVDLVVRDSCQAIA